MAEVRPLRPKERSKSKESHPLLRQIFRVFDLLEKPIEWLIRICGWSSILGIIAIFVFILKEAAPMIPKLDWHLFFTSTRWIPIRLPEIQPVMAHSRF